MSGSGLTRARLDQLTGKNIKDICPNPYHDNDHNHCAHFVSHVMQYAFGCTCNQVSSGETGVCVRVQEIFPRCPQVGRWEDDRTDASRLVFVTAHDNVSLERKTIANVPKKHIGIYLSSTMAGQSSGRIWHYLNSQDKVVVNTEEEFETYFKRVYGRKATLFFGAFPV